MKRGRRKQASPGAAKSRRAVAAQLPSDLLLRTMIDSLPFTFWMVGADQRYVMQNARCRRDWGDLVGKRPDEIAPTQDIRTAWRDTLGRAFAGESIEHESGYPVGGELRTFLGMITPVRERGRVTHVMGFHIDRTEHKAMVENRHCVERAESLGLMAGGIAHDFNNVLTAVAGSLSLYRSEAARGSFRDELLNNAELACRRAHTLIQQLLTLARGGQPVREATPVRDLLDEALRMATAGSACRFDLDAPNDLWPVLADVTQIYQALANVALNGVQAMPKGGVIQVSARNERVPVPRDELTPGPYVVIRLRDQGVGINPDDLPKIFDPYFSRRTGGSGLGLAIVFAVVRNHGGRVSVGSTPEEGTQVTIVLPAAPSTSTAHATA